MSAQILPFPKVQQQYAVNFEALWVVYPRKVSKRAAYLAWQSALKRADSEEIWDGLNRQIEHLRANRHFCPHLATWLNGDRWADEIEQAPLPGQKEEASWVDTRISHYRHLLKNDPIKAAQYWRQQAPAVQKVLHADD